jgi:hypothetical protein
MDPCGYTRSSSTALRLAPAGDRGLAGAGRLQRARLPLVAVLGAQRPAGSGLAVGATPARPRLRCRPLLHPLRFPPLPSFVASILRGKPLPSTRRYLRNRALRIAPAYLVILLLVSLVFRSALTHSPDGGAHSGALTKPGLLAENALHVQNYTPSSILTGIGPAWSLAVEVVFYLALPGLALLGWILARSASSRQRRRVAALAPALLMLAIGVSGKIVAAHVFHPGIYHGWEADWESVIERSFWCQADILSSGWLSP